MDNETMPQLIQPEAKQDSHLILQTFMLIALLVIMGFQTLTLRSIAQSIKNGGVAVNSGQAQVGSQAQGTGSILDSLKSQVGGCGG